jgi:hypothetical protein
MDASKREAHLAMAAQRKAERKAAEAEAQQPQPPATMVYKAIENSPSAADNSDDLRCVLEAVDAVLECCKRQQSEIDALRDENAALRDKVDCYIKTPRDMVDAARELNAQTKKALAAVAKLHDASERELERRSEVLDLPALPRRRDSFN